MADRPDSRRRHRHRRSSFSDQSQSDDSYRHRRPRARSSDKPRGDDRRPDRRSSPGRRRRRPSPSRSPDRDRPRERPRDDKERTKSHRSRRHSPSSSDSDSRARRKGDRDPHPDRHRHRRRSHSPPATDRPPKAVIPFKRNRSPLPSQDNAYTSLTKPHSGPGSAGPSDAPVEKQKPNFAPSGALAAETNRVTGTDVVLKYNEPAEARKPPPREAWRLYVFKGSELLETLELRERSCWLMGRERAVVDFPVEHPSCSKQHAVVQFRWVTKTSEFGDKEGRVRPYLIDLESANGSLVNGERIPPSRYVELRDKDMIQFGLSSREYVLMLPPAG